MKRFFSVGGLLTLALLAAGTGSAEAQGPKIGYVNTQELVAKAPGAAQAQQSFNQDMNAYRAQVQALGEELEKLQTDYEAQQATLSEAARQQRQQQFQQRFTAAQDSVQKLEQRAAQRQQQFNTTMQPIMDRIKAAIEAVRTEEKYALLFDAGDSGIIAADPALDATARVLAKLGVAAGTGNR